jgi:HEAT repeat protein
MIRKRRKFALATVFCASLCVGICRAQDDPFAPDAEGPAAVDPPPPAVEPGTKPVAPKEPEGPTEEDIEAAKKALEERRAKAIERERLQPVLDAITETRPSSPVELIGAINSLIDLNQPDEAKKYITKLLALKLNDEALYVLQRRVGSGVFFKLAGDQRYHPEGKELADEVLIAAQKQSRDPKRLALLIKQLSDPAPEVRSGALSDLKSGGIDAVLLMIAAMGDDARRDEHARIRYSLAQMGSIVVEPLIGTLASPSANLKAQAIEILGLLEARRATPYLIHPLLSSKQPHPVREAAKFALDRIVRAIPTEKGGEAYLYQRIVSLTSGDLPRRPDAEGNIELWLWDPARKLPVAITYAAADAALVEAAQLAVDLYDLRPESVEYRRLYLLAILESAKLVNGLDRSLPTGKGSARELAGRTGVEAVEDLLVEAIRQNRIAAAIGAVEVLGDIGNEQVLLSQGGDVRPLVEALSHTDRRLRFAAAEAIIKIDPHHDYAGASLLPETLGYLASTAGVRRVLIGHPQSATAQSLVGMLAEMGFEADTATTGRQFFFKATESPDYEFLLLSDAISQPSLNETLQALRTDRRTGSLPIGIMAREERLSQLQLEAAEDDKLTLVFPRPHERATLELQVQRLIPNAGRQAISGEERARHAAAALAWLSRLAENQGRYGFYDLLRQVPQAERALYGGAASRPAAEVLGLIGSSRAQQALVDFASQGARPIADRQAAATAFKTAVARRGLLLYDADIDLQYDRYNQSESLDAATQQVLGDVLDVIERKLLAQRSGEEVSKE